MDTLQQSQLDAQRRESFNLRSGGQSNQTASSQRGALSPRSIDRSSRPTLGGNGQSIRDSQVNQNSQSQRDSINSANDLTKVQSTSVGGQSPRPLKKRQHTKQDLRGAAKEVQKVHKDQVTVLEISSKDGKNNTIVLHSFPTLEEIAMLLDAEDAQLDGASFFSRTSYENGEVREFIVIDNGHQKSLMESISIRRSSNGSPSRLGSNGVSSPSRRLSPTKSPTVSSIDRSLNGGSLDRSYSGSDRSFDRSFDSNRSLGTSSASSAVGLGSINGTTSRSPLSPRRTQGSPSSRGSSPGSSIRSDTRDTSGLSGLNRGRYSPVSGSDGRNPTILAGPDRSRYPLTSSGADLRDTSGLSGLSGLDNSRYSTGPRSPISNGNGASFRTVNLSNGTAGRQSSPLSPRSVGGVGRSVGSPQRNLSSGLGNGYPNVESQFAGNDYNVYGRGSMSTLSNNSMYADTAWDDFQ